MSKKVNLQNGVLKKIFTRAEFEAYWADTKHLEWSEIPDPAETPHITLFQNNLGQIMSVPTAKGWEYDYGAMVYEDIERYKKIKGVGMPTTFGDVFAAEFQQPDRIADLLADAKVRLGIEETVPPSEEMLRQADRWLLERAQQGYDPAHDFDPAYLRALIVVLGEALRHTSLAGARWQVERVVVPPDRASDEEEIDFIAVLRHPNGEKADISSAVYKSLFDPKEYEKPSEILQGHFRYFGRLGR